MEKYEMKYYWNRYTFFHLNKVEYYHLKRFPIIVEEKLGYRVRKTLGQKGPGGID